MSSQSLITGLAKDKEFKRSQESKGQSGQSVKPQQCSCVLTLPRDIISRPVTQLALTSLSVGISCPSILC